jgi:hypothetical protein
MNIKFEFTYHSALGKYNMQYYVVVCSIKVDVNNVRINRPLAFDEYNIRISWPWALMNIKLEFTDHGISGHKIRIYRPYIKL